jgi:hypothetical protein|tara:strand:+ start:32481 stop:32645 length:165 start_codon:yes stop_codon:yes gene_type:complete
MRVSEYIDYITRKDLGLGKNPSAIDYTHFTARMIHKRQRYDYQRMLRDINKEKL